MHNTRGKVIHNMQNRVEWNVIEKMSLVTVQIQGNQILN